MDPIKLDVNKTTTFLLPMLFPNSTHDEIFSNYFKQAYIGLLDDEMPNSSIILEFDEDKITPDLIEDFLRELEPSATLTDTKDNLIFFDILKEDLEDYDNILSGKYSKISKKDDILDFWKEDENSLLHGILYNDSELVEKHTPYLNRQIIHELNDVSEESWPPPNLFVDEFLVV